MKQNKGYHDKNIYFTTMVTGYSHHCENIINRKREKLREKNYQRIVNRSTSELKDGFTVNVKSVKNELISVVYKKGDSYIEYIQSRGNTNRTTNWYIKAESEKEEVVLMQEFILGIGKLIRANK